jgi:hypothetical protein
MFLPLKRELKRVPFIGVETSWENGNVQPLPGKQIPAK